MRRPRGARRREERLRDERRLRRVREMRDVVAPRRFRVTVPANTRERGARADVRDLVLDSLRRYPQLKAQPAELKDGVLGVSIEVEARNEPEARTKALYWCRQATRIVQAIRWMEPPRSWLTVEEL